MNKQEFCEELRRALDQWTFPPCVDGISDRDEVIRRAALELARFVQGFICDHTHENSGEWCLPEDFQPEHFWPVVLEFAKGELGTFRPNEVNEVGEAFLACYDKVADPYGHDPLELAVKRAKRIIGNGDDSKLVFKHQSPGVTFIVQIAEQLQRLNPKRPIYLPQERLGELMGARQQSVSRYIQIAIRKEKLKLVRSGCKESKQASLYWYLSDNEA